MWKTTEWRWGGVALTDHMTLTTAICILGHVNLCNSRPSKPAFIEVVASTAWVLLDAMVARPYGFGKSKKSFNWIGLKHLKTTNSSWPNWVWKCLTLKWGMWSGRSPNMWSQVKARCMAPCPCSGVGAGKFKTRGQCYAFLHEALYHIQGTGTG